MFSSNPFQHIPSSIHVYPSSSFFELEKDGVPFNHYNDINQLVSGDCIFDAYGSLVHPPVIADNIMVTQQELITEDSGFHYCDDKSNLLGSVIYSSKKKMTNMKKDGHSKIHTAQGPRDRRVRLSIEVARKFFSLQDLLGFDKASKTLDWLFTKSKTAIKELVEEMKQCSSSGATDHCEVVFQETIKSGSDEENKGQKKKSTQKYDEGKKRKMSRKYKSGVDVNQSRAEARARARERARERTREKLQSKKLDDESKKFLDNSYGPASPATLTPRSSFWNESESQNFLNLRSGELIVEPKGPMPSSMFYAYQHFESNDLNSQNKNTSFLNLH